jgi:hypothetical protein
LRAYFGKMASLHGLMKESLIIIRWTTLHQRLFRVVRDTRSTPSCSTAFQS